MPIPAILIKLGWALLVKSISAIIDVQAEKMKCRIRSGVEKKNKVIAKITQFVNEHALNIENVPDFTEGLYQIIKEYNFFKAPSLLLYAIEKVWEQEAREPFKTGAEKKQHVIFYVNEYLENHNIIFDRQDELVDDIVKLLRNHKLFEIEE